MKFLIPVVVAFVFVNMASTLSQAERVSRATAELIETDEQPDLSGIDTKYRHGDHCIDGRAF